MELLAQPARYDKSACVRLATNLTMRMTDNISTFNQRLYPLHSPLLEYTEAHVIFAYAVPSLWSALCLMGVIGNCVNLVVLLDTEKRNRPSNIFLSLMAITDVAFLLTLMVGRALQLTTDYIRSTEHLTAANNVWITGIANIFCTASVWICATVSIERMTAVKSPMHARLYWRRSRVLRIFAAIIVTSCFANVYQMTESTEVEQAKCECYKTNANLWNCTFRNYDCKLQLPVRSISISAVVTSEFLHTYHTVSRLIHMATVILAPFTLLVTITVTLNYYLRAHEAHMATQNVHKSTFRHRINKDKPATERNTPRVPLADVECVPTENGDETDSPITDSSTTNGKNNQVTTKPTVRTPVISMVKDSQRSTVLLLNQDSVKSSEQAKAAQALAQTKHRRRSRVRERRAMRTVTHIALGFAMTNLLSAALTILRVANPDIYANHQAIPLMISASNTLVLMGRVANFVLFCTSSAHFRHRLRAVARKRYASFVKWLTPAYVGLHGSRAIMVATVNVLGQTRSASTPTPLPVPISRPPPPQRPRSQRLSTQSTFTSTSLYGNHMPIHIVISEADTTQHQPVHYRKDSGRGARRTLAGTIHNRAAMLQKKHSLDIPSNRACSRLSEEERSSEEHVIRQLSEISSQTIDSSRGDTPIFVTRSWEI